jgi:hypothetical protein
MKCKNCNSLMLQCFADDIHYYWFCNCDYDGNDQIKKGVWSWMNEHRKIPSLPVS